MEPAHSPRFNIYAAAPDLLAQLSKLSQSLHHGTLGAKLLHHLLVPALLMRRAHPAQGEVKARHDDRSDDGAADYQPDDANGRLLRYSSGAMVTRSPASSAVNSI